MRRVRIVLLFACALLSPTAFTQGNSLPRIRVRLATAPAYPPLAVTTNTAGDVIVAITVNKHGDVTKAEIVTGHPLLRHAAIEAAKRWKFSVAAEERQVQLTFSFRIVPRETPEGAMTAMFMPPYHVEVKRKLPAPTVNYEHGH